jgi:DNA-binding GntR family transcriptional regulator
VDRVVNLIRQAIFDGEINSGEQLREAALSESLGVARSTVREALRVLESCGLISRSPNRGATVRQLSAAEVEDIFRARLVLETEAARAARDCPEEMLEKLSLAMDAYAAEARAGDPSRAASAHVDFHAALVALTGSMRLAETERAMMQDLQLAIASIDKSSDDLPKEVEKHRELRRLFMERRVDEAIRALEADLEHAKAFVLRCAAD